MTHAKYNHMTSIPHLLHQEVFKFWVLDPVTVTGKWCCIFEAEFHTSKILAEIGHFRPHLTHTSLSCHYFVISRSYINEEKLFFVTDLGAILVQTCAILTFQLAVYDILATFKESKWQKWFSQPISYHHFKFEADSF